MHSAIYETFDIMKPAFLHIPARHPDGNRGGIQYCLIKIRNPVSHFNGME